MPEADAAADLTLLRESAIDAGEIARKHFGGEFKRWSKSPGNPVTEADLEIDHFLTERLRGARPDYGWLSEETEDNAARLSKRRVFVVDPIDGTIAFMKGKPHFTICAAVVEDGVPVTGVVYNPISGECFSACLGQGAHCDGKRIRVSDCDAVEGCRMAGDRTKLTTALGWPEMKFESRNSVAYRLSLVANGTFDAALALSAKCDWDLAAADLIVREAGGNVTDAKGAALRYNRPNAIQMSFVAAGPKLHAQLLAQLQNVAN